MKAAVHPEGRLPRSKGCAYPMICRVAAARQLCVAVTVAASLAGCAVGPDFERPSKPGAAAALTPEPLPAQTAAASTPGGAPQRLLPSQDLPAQWWTLFHSPALNRLVDRAIEHSPDLQSAQAALRVAQENSLAQQGFYYPNVAASYTPNRQRAATGSLTSPLASGESIFNLHTVQVTVGYTFDVFGSNRRQVESLDALAEAQRWQLDAVYLSLTSNLVVGAIQEASIRAQIDATRQLVGIQQEELALFETQLKAGAIPEANVIAQKAALAYTRAMLAPLRKQLIQQRDALIALAGELPGEAVPEEFQLSMLDLPLDLPLSLPSRLVEQRPDVKAAEAQLHSASAQIGVATANLLPQFSLSADAGSVATVLGQLFTSGTNFWSLAGTVAQPLFDGGTLLHRRRAAVAAYDQASAQYRSAVVLAFQNVADTLQALQLDADALNDAVVAEQSASSSLTIAKRQLELGDTSYLALLSANQAYAQAELGLVQARANRFADTAALFQALGGGWWNSGKS